MASVHSNSFIPSATRKSPPKLGNGDRLTRDDFERRYRATTEVRRAELIEGIVYISPPVRYHSHGMPHSALNAWLLHYVAKTSASLGYADNTTVRLDNDNQTQPDLFLLLPAHLGGKSKVDEDDYISGPPALVCEVAASTVSIDLHLKKTVYRRNGVQEYLVWRTEDSAIDWFSLVGGEFVSLSPESDGTLRSRVFPGLWLNPATLMSADLPAVFALLDRSTSTPEHADFVKRLSAV